MQRRLVLVRHAKSAWDDPSLADHDRPLAPRGLKALPRLREYLIHRSWHPDLVWCSSSRRTVETLAGVRSVLPDDVAIEVEGQLYGASAADILDGVRRIGPGVGCAMVIGHNPGLHDLAMLLGGAGDDDLRSRLSAKFPTGAMVTIAFDGEWDGLSDGAGRIEELFVPRRSRP